MYIVGVSVLFVFLLFVISKQTKKTSDYLLIAVIGMFGLYLFSLIWISKELTATNFILRVLALSYLLPCILIYGLTRIRKKSMIRKKWWWIFSFAILFTLFIPLDFIVLNDYGSKSELGALLIHAPPLSYLILYKGQQIFIIVALTWFLKKLKLYRAKAKEDNQYTYKIRLTWFRNFIYTYLAQAIFMFITFSLYDLGAINSMQIPMVIGRLTLVTALFYLCYCGIRDYMLTEYQETLGPGNKEYFDLANATAGTRKNVISKYSSSTLTESEMTSIFNQVTQLFENEKVYLDPNLKILHLSERLQISVHKISQTINTKTKKSFHDFVNEFRVNHFKELLSDFDNKKYTILALGIESGFNSKATLNRAFKQHLGVTPKQFRKINLLPAS